MPLARAVFFKGSVLQVLIVGILLFLQAPYVAALTLIPVPFLVAGSIAYTLSGSSRYRGQRQAASLMNSLLHDNIIGIREIKAFTRESAELRRFSAASDSFRRASLVVIMAWAVYNPSMSFFISCGMVIVAGFGGKAVLNGQMELGELVACLILVRFFYEPIGRLYSLNQIFQAGKAAGERVFEIIDSPRENALSDDPTFNPVGRIEYRDVSFEYALRRKVLRSVSFIAEAGQTVAIVGATGAGKSTLVSLLLRFYELDENGGDILIDDRSIRDLPKTAIRRVTGFVSQETFLFNGTIRQNLLVGREDAVEEELEKALVSSNVWSFVRHLPDGLDTMVGERGVKLSVGEKQRISIARALLKNPPIVILDEATASVDTQTERQIQQALGRLLLRRTSFVIAHRLSTVQHADQISAICTRPVWRTPVSAMERSE